MKKISILLLFMCCFSTKSVYSQDLINEIKTLTLTNDSLQKQTLANKDSISKLNTNLNKIKKDLEIADKKVTELNKNKVKKERDNFKKERDSLKKENDGFNKELDGLKKENDDFKKNLDSLKNENDTSKKNLDSLKNENDTLKKKHGSLKNENDSLKKETNNLNKKKMQITETYNKPFDELIKSSTKQFVDRDLSIIHDINDEKIKKKLQDLQKYFTIEQVLSERYNEQKVKNAQNQITSIEQSELVKKLAEKLKDYKLCNDALKETIEKIFEIDRKVTANDDYSQRKKTESILFELSWYFRNYSFNFIDYPYLSKIVLEIMNLKQKDANTDIIPLFNKL